MAATAPKAGGSDDVLVPPEVSTELFKHLQAQGRGIVASPADAHRRLTAIVAATWGSPDAKRFTDDNGGGWVVDISEAVEGEALHAVVRTVLGRRTVLAVVDDDEFAAFNQDGKWKSEAANRKMPPGVDEAVLAEANAIEGGQGMVPRAPAPARGTPVQAMTAAVLADPNDPALVLVYESTKVGDSAPILHSERCTRAEVPGVVKMLLRRGLDGKPIDEDQIEIWSSLSKPKLEVKF